MQLQGKIVNFLGDSITEGVGVQTCLQLRYHQVMKRNYRLKEANVYGIGGSRLAHQRMPSAKPRWDLCFAGRAATMAENADMVVVYGGVNDWFHGDAPFGVVSDTTPSTFCGAVRYLMNYLKSAYANKPIIFMTPARCCFNGISSNGISSHEYKQADAKPLKAYVEAIQQIGECCGVYVLDLYDGLGIDPNNPADKEQYTVDGLHFNAAGHAAIADRLGEFLSKL